MIHGITNQAKAELLNLYFKNGGPFRVALITAADFPGVDTKLFSEMTEIAPGNGYEAGGKLLTLEDFLAALGNDETDSAKTEVPFVSWTAEGGPIPAEGEPARYLVMTDGNEVLDDRKVIGIFDLEADSVIVANQEVKYQHAAIELVQVP